MMMMMEATFYHRVAPISFDRIGQHQCIIHFHGAYFQDPTEPSIQWKTDDIPSCFKPKGGENIVGTTIDDEGNIFILSLCANTFSLTPYYPPKTSSYVQPSLISYCI